MYEVSTAHPLTLIVIIATLLVTPLYVFSGASKTKGLLIALGFLGFGTLMFWICLAAIPNRVGLAGQSIVPLAWLLPSLILILFRNWFLAEPLSQRWLIGLQVFRVIGGVFLIEMTIGNLPGIFAYPAGIGDIITGILAISILWKYRHWTRIDSSAILLIFAIGVADFVSAFFFGFFSSVTPLQLFFPKTENTVITFPTGMIPLFLVPYAIVLHTLSILNLRKFGSQ